MATAPKTTRIADDTSQTIPQTTAPGDAPADTYDPAERVSSVDADKAAAAAAGHLTVNAVEPVASIPAPAAVANPRFETVPAYGANGTSAVNLARNIDTGASAPLKTWTASTAFAKGDFVVISSKYLECTTAGTSGSTAPTAPGSVGGTVTDGTAVWTRRS